jgi:hypothetical protein
MPLNPNRDSFAVSGLDGNFFFITSGPLKQLKFPCPSVTTDPPSKSPTTPRLPKVEKRGPPEDLLPIQNTEIRISPPDYRRHGEACAPPSIVPHAGRGVVVEKYFRKLRLVDPNPFIQAAITSLSTVDAPAWAQVTWKRERGQIGELTQRRL